MNVRALLPLLLVAAGCGSGSGLHVENNGHTVRTQGGGASPPATTGTAPATLPRHVTARVEVGGETRLAWDGSTVWAAAWPAGPGALGSLIPIEARTGTAGKPLPLPPSPRAYLIAASRGRIWVTAGNRVLRIDPASGALIASTDVGGPPRALLAARGSLWVTVAVGPVVQLDPDHLHVVRKTTVTPAPYALTTLGGSVYVTDEQQQTLVRLDPRTGRSVSTISIRGSGAQPPSEITAYGDSIWVYEGSSVVRVGPLGARVLDRIALKGDGGSMAAGTGGIWTTGAFGVARIDPVTGELNRPIALGSPGESLATTGDAVWVATSGAVLRVSA
ncbi:MAG: virginiamycin lyase [Gaiellales bacterium]|nr:virginiamycin lyase [Gaiellales bacterium]